MATSFSWSLPREKGPPRSRTPVERNAAVKAAGIINAYAKKHRRREENTSKNQLLISIHRIFSFFFFFVLSFAPAQRRKARTSSLSSDSYLYRGVLIQSGPFKRGHLNIFSNYMMMQKIFFA